jgi:nucleotide-binding universal stress UspA family protein
MAQATRIMVAVEQLDGLDAVVNAISDMDGGSAAEVVVLHVQAYERYGGPSYAIESLSDINLLTELAVFKLSMAGIEARSWVVSALYDKRADAIVAAADGWGADRIVLASARPRSFSWLRKPLIQRLQAKATCPVLVVDRDAATPVVPAPTHALEHSGRS